MTSKSVLLHVGYSALSFNFVQNTTHILITWAYNLMITKLSTSDNCFKESMAEQEPHVGWKDSETCFLGCEQTGKGLFASRTSTEISPSIRPRPIHFVDNLHRRSTTPRPCTNRWRSVCSKHETDARACCPCQKQVRLTSVKAERCLSSMTCQSRDHMALTPWMADPPRGAG